MPKVAFLLCPLGALLLAVAPVAARPSIAFVPMYATPVARQLPPMLGAIAGVAVAEPPLPSLGGYIEPGDVPTIATWLRAEAAAGTASFVVSTDMLAYGGLDPSRVPGGVDTRLAVERLGLLAALRHAQPRAWIAAFGTIMRLEPTAVAPVGSAANYDPIAQYPTWEYLLAYAKLHAPPLPSEVEQARTLRERIGEPTLANYLATRARNRDVDLKVLQTVADGTTDRVVLGQDDAGPVGLHVADVRALQDAVARLGIGDRAAIEPGADELGAALVANALTRSIGWTPRVAVRYSLLDGGTVQDPLEFAPISVTIDALIRLCGATRDDLHPDVALYVRVPNTDAARDDALVRDLSRSIASGTSTALVDLTFLSGSYQPQATFMETLLRSRLAGKLDAYSGWNTDANSAGIALSEALAASVGRRHGTYDPIAHAELMAERLLDDYLYHDVVRPEVNASLDARGITDHTYLAPDVAADAERTCRALLEPLARELLRRLYPQYEVGALTIALPWPRTFEIETIVRLAAR